MTFIKNYSRNRNDNKNMFLYFSKFFYINNKIKKFAKINLFWIYCNGQLFLKNL